MNIGRQASAESVPQPSATVALVRDARDGPELLLVLRHAKSSFGSTYVFPGGLLGPEDAEVGERCDGIDEARANRTLDMSQDGIAYYSAAIRELFEETGVLLARTRDAAWADATTFARYRQPLNDGDLSWQRFLERYDLRLAGDALHYFSFWITPREVSRRWSTRFFLAALPAGQIAEHCGTELTDSRWLSVSRALRENEAGDIALPHPTVINLQSLGRFDDTRSMLVWADRQSRNGIGCVRPAVVGVGDERRIVMPGDPDYPEYPEYGDAPGRDE